MKLREELTGKQVVASDNSSIRQFVRDAILVDVAVPEAPATQPVSEPAGPTESVLAPASTQPTENASAPTTQPTQTASMPTTQPTDPVVNAVADAAHSDDPSDPCDNNVTQWWDDFSLRAGADREPWRGSFGWLGELFAPKPFDPDSLRLKQDEPSSSPKVIVTELTEDDGNAGVDPGK